MANQQHRKFIEQGADEWNMRRALFPEFRPDLSGVNLNGADLQQADLSGADLSGAELRQANLSGANLSESDLQEANLCEANLVGADLSGAHLNGVYLVGAHLNEAYLDRADLSESDLSGAYLIEAELQQADFQQADLSGTNLSGANFRQANLSGADLSGAILTEAYFIDANLSGADLSGADLSRAHFIKADLSRADLRQSDLSEANFSEANFSGADLSRTILVGTNLSNITLTDCTIYGISAWDVQLDGAKQLNLTITREDQLSITVDNLKIAQFIYLLLNNEEIRDVINTLTTKSVLLLGRFTPERKEILEAIRDELRLQNYVPMLFDFDQPISRDITETVTTLARLARFIIADLTDAKSIPQELAFIVPDLPSVPVQPILLSSQREYSMFEHFTNYPWVLPIHQYSDLPHLLTSLKEYVILPAEKKAKELEK